MELAQRTLCESGVDYGLLIDSLALVKNIVTCDGKGSVQSEDPAIKILKKMFADDGNGTGVWSTISGTDNSGCVIYDYEGSCFNDLNVYYHNKDCGFNSCPWNPTIDLSGDHPDCIKSALDKLGVPTDDLSFKTVIDEMAKFLGAVGSNASYCQGVNNDGNVIKAPHTLECVLIVLKALCEILKQRVVLDRVLRKTIITTNTCEL